MTGQQMFGGPEDPEVAELRDLAERARAKEAELSAEFPLGYPRYGQVSWDNGEPLQDTAIVPFWNAGLLQTNATAEHWGNIHDDSARVSMTGWPEWAKTARQKWQKREQQKRNRAKKKVEGEQLQRAAAAASEGTGLAVAAAVAAAQREVSREYADAHREELARAAARHKGEMDVARARQGAQTQKLQEERRVAAAREKSKLDKQREAAAAAAVAAAAAAAQLKQQAVAAAAAEADLAQRGAQLAVRERRLSEKHAQERAALEVEREAFRSIVAQGRWSTEKLSEQEAAAEAACARAEVAEEAAAVAEGAAVEAHQQRKTEAAVARRQRVRFQGERLRLRQLEADELARENEAEVEGVCEEEEAEDDEPGAEGEGGAEADPKRLKLGSTSGCTPCTPAQPVGVSAHLRSSASTPTCGAAIGKEAHRQFQHLRRDGRVRGNNTAGDFPPLVRGLCRRMMSKDISADVAADTYALLMGAVAHLTPEDLPDSRYMRESLQEARVVGLLMNAVQLAAAIEHLALQGDGTSDVDVMRGMQEFFACVAEIIDEHGERGTVHMDGFLKSVGLTAAKELEVCQMIMGLMKEMLVEAGDGGVEEAGS